MHPSPLNLETKEKIKIKCQIHVNEIRAKPGIEENGAIGMREMRALTQKHFENDAKCFFFVRLSSFSRDLV